jgi:uridine kinase
LGKVRPHMKKLYTDLLFLVGLGIRIALIFLVLPVPVADWYVPFLEASIAKPTLDPWSVWLGQGGDLAAFPYGYAMWLAFLPLTLICGMFGLPLHLGYAFTLLVADLSLLAIFRRLLPSRERLLLAAYWLSPIVLIATYVLGLNDLVPVLLLVLSLYFTRQLKLFLAGVFCVLAISAKLSMVLALPFFAVYFLHSRALHRLLPSFLKGMVVAVVAFGLPFLFSGAALQMLLSNPEMGKVYQFALTIGHGVSVYVVPLVYLVMMYGAWRVRRMNFELFQSMLGMAFLLVVLLTPASPGWFIWAVPLLVNYQAMSGRIAIVLSAAFSAFYVLSTLLALPSVPFGLGHADTAILALTGHLEPHVASLLHTAMVAIGIVLALRIWRETVSRNDYFRLSRRPFVIGIAGDSGSGKDTLADALQGLFGDHSVAKLSGDDYHLWDRQKPIWQAMTHLNPMANDLEGFANDLVSLIDGKSIIQRHYDHKTGIRSEQMQVKSNDFIIVSGLHALYLPILRTCFNLSIYLDIDEGLRRHLKKVRDVGQRGHSVEQVLSSFAKREPDSEKFIRPQAAYADLVLSLHPIHPRLLEETDGKRPLHFKLLARSRNGLNELSLTRVLVGVCGLHVDMATSNDASEVELTIEGETSAEDVALAAQMLCPRALEFLDIRPKWADGVLGLMQLITLSHINQALTKRFL